MRLEVIMDLARGTELSRAGIQGWTADLHRSGALDGLVIGFWRRYNSSTPQFHHGHSHDLEPSTYSPPGGYAIEDNHYHFT